MFSNIPISEGDQIQIISANGAGYGDPLARDPEHVLMDVVEDLLTEQQAEEHFGVVILNGTIDDSATQTRREQEIVR